MHTMIPTDLELWRAFYLRPDEATFRPVYEETKALVHTLCLRILRDDAETKDAFQSTYCRLLLLARRKEKAAEVEDFRRLIGRLAIREADRLRKRRDRRSLKERAMDAMENVPAKDLDAHLLDTVE